MHATTYVCTPLPPQVTYTGTILMLFITLIILNHIPIFSGSEAGPTPSLLAAERVTLTVVVGKH